MSILPVADPITEIDLKAADLSVYRQQFADCIVLDARGRLLLQERPERGGDGMLLSAFGGRVEGGETVLQALARELKEELGADVLEEDVKFLGAVSEAFTDHRDVVHIHFWQDKHKTVTGCYEWDLVVFDKVEDVFKHPGMMDYLGWGLRRCQDKGYLRR